MCTFLHDWWLYVQIQETWLGDRRSEREAKAARQFSKMTALDKATLCCTKHRGRLSSIPLSCERRAQLHLCLLSSLKRVLEFNISKYTKAPKELTAMCVCTSAKDRVWVCRTCDYALRWGRIPAQVKPNNLDLSKDSLHEDGGTPLWQTACDSRTSSQCTPRSDTCVYPSSKAVVPSSDGGFISHLQ